MDIKNLVPVNFSNQRVILTAQLAEVYDTTPKNISDNFNRAKEQFKEGVHYFKLTGEALRQFKRHSELIGIPVEVSTAHLYLWTAPGIFLHAKMLNTNKAWALFNKIGAKITAPVLEEIIFGVQNAPVAKEKACLYVLEMSDDTVKIGATSDLERRKIEIQCATKLQIRRSFRGIFFPACPCLSTRNEMSRYPCGKMSSRRILFLALR